MPRKKLEKLVTTGKFGMAFDDDDVYSHIYGHVHSAVMLIILLYFELWYIFPRNFRVEVENDFTLYTITCIF